MPIPYKKPYTQGRCSTSGGPRDLQRKQLQREGIDGLQIELLESLHAQIKLLKDQLNSSSESDKDFNDEVSNIIKKETAKHRKRINELEKENEILQAKIQNSDVLIEQLKQIKVVDSSVRPDEPEPDRPVIEEIFVDPIENELDVTESHIKTEETIGAGKEAMLDQVFKLKKLLGKDVKRRNR